MVAENAGRIGADGFAGGSGGGDQTAGHEYGGNEQQPGRVYGRDARQQALEKFTDP
jgi:hypothetical protein